MSKAEDLIGFNVKVSTGFYVRLETLARLERFLEERGDLDPELTRGRGQKGKRAVVVRESCREWLNSVDVDRDRAVRVIQGDQAVGSWQFSKDWQVIKKKKLIALQMFPSLKVAIERAANSFDCPQGVVVDVSIQWWLSQRGY